MRQRVLLLSLLAFMAASWPAGAVDDLRKELDQVKKELEGMRGVKEELEALKKQKSDGKAPIASAKASVENKYGPNSNVTTKQGKLTIGGLVQIWYYSIQNDNLGFYGDVSPTTPGGGDSNETRDNDSFTVRRAEFNFSVDVTENVTGVLRIDAARAIQGRPSFSTNTGLYSRTGVTTAAAAAVRDGDFTQGFRMLQDAYINYHGVVPHHDFTIGQHKPQLGDEGLLSTAALDFAERSMIGQFGDKRDIGLTAHGTWWDDRFQYWLGAFNSPGDFFGTRGADQQNRVDDNDEKDFVWRVLVRPVWKHERWGSLELGASGQHGIHGEAGGPEAAGGTVDGLNRRGTQANRYYFWASYRPGGPVKGWWIKGEYAWIQDRAAPGSVSGFGAAGFANNTAVYQSPNPFDVEGFYISTGYRISESVWKDSAPGWLKNFEFALRYEQFENVLTADLVSPNSRTDTFATDIWTAGINYYIKGNNAKIQLNYCVVDDPDAGSSSLRGRTAATAPRHFRGVDNNSFIVNFQVGW